MAAVAVAATEALIIAAMDVLTVFVTATDMAGAEHTTFDVAVEDLLVSASWISSSEETVTSADDICAWLTRELAFDLNKSYITA